MSDLKPCPACGGTSISLQRMTLQVYDRWELRCKSCSILNTISFPTKEDAISKWNDLWCWKEIDRLLQESAEYMAEGNKFTAMADTLADTERQFSALKAQYEEEVGVLKTKIKKLAEVRTYAVPATANVDLEKLKQPASIVSDGIDWKHRYEKIKDAYVRTRLEVSGSFGNWDYATRKRVLEHEVSNEVGFII